jgi:hypothetical protein
MFLAALSIFPPLTVLFAWVGSNAGGDLKRGVMLAMVIGLGGMGGYPPRFHISYVSSLTSGIVISITCLRHGMLLSEPVRDVGLQPA